MLRWLESRIDPFERRAIAHPPGRCGRSTGISSRPIWPVFGLVLVFDLLAALTEVALAHVRGRPDRPLMGRPTRRAPSWPITRGSCCGWRSSCSIARPVIIVAYELTKNQVLSPPFQTRVRWQTHRYLLRQSLGFFQNDFAGRVANKLMQTATALRNSFLMLSDAAVFVAVQWVSALVLFWAVGLASWSFRC